MTTAASYQIWQVAWGTPRAVFVSEGGRFQAMLLVAVFMHAALLGSLWKYRADKKIVNMVELQNVDLMEPESEAPPAPPPVAVEKPKSALDFLKMAIPSFRKPAVPEIRDITPTIKREDPKLAEPARLIDKKLQAQAAAPDIKLDKSAAAPKIADIAKIPQAQRPEIPVARDPSIKLEEVGRRAVQAPLAPSISMHKSARSERVADISAIPRQSSAPGAAAPAERLVEKSAPAGYSKPSSLPMGYQTRGGSVSLDAPRDVVRTAAKPAIETPIPKPKSDSGALSISKEKVKITGPLSSRKVVKSYVPQYPDWARAQSIEADVAIRFTVSPAGDISGRPVIERTSGYPEMDKLCLDTLTQWKFTPLSGEQDQWGVITFRFTLD